jgi:hypothetical protein
MLAQWLLLGVGAMVIIAALNQSAPWAAALSGVACFIAIAARIIQAEGHQLRRR